MDAVHHAMYHAIDIPCHTQLNRSWWLWGNSWTRRWWRRWWRGVDDDDDGHRDNDDDHPNSYGYGHGHIRMAMITYGYGLAIAMAMIAYGNRYAYVYIWLWLWYADIRDMRHNLHHLFGFASWFASSFSVWEHRCMMTPEEKQIKYLHWIVVLPGISCILMQWIFGMNQSMTHRI